MRYAIVGHRPGEVFHTPVGIIATDPIDGGARLNDAQKAYFERSGERLRPIATDAVATPEAARPTGTDDGLLALGSLTREAQTVPGAAQVVSAGRKRGGGK